MEWIIGIVLGIVSAVCIMKFCNNTKKRNVSNNYGGVPAAQSEPYELMGESKRKKHKTEDAWWASPIVIIILTIAFSAMDGLVLYSVMDKAMMQNMLLSIITAGGIALVLNIIPLLVAKFIHQAIYKTKRFALTWAIVSIVAFIILFAGTVYLRFVYKDMYGTNLTSQLVNTVSSDDADKNVQKSDGEKALAVVILLAVEPLATSIANFLLAFLSDDEVRKRIEFLEIREIELCEAISDLRAAIATMEHDIAQELAMDERAMLAAIQQVASRCNILKADARNMLAEYVKEPSAISMLSNELLSTSETNNFIREDTEYNQNDTGIDIKCKQNDYEFNYNSNINSVA